ncbi:MAG: hypothetical protein HGA93_01665 [Methanothrix sp.]|nr:hypothetical protein [Methanothrix sp.]
MQQVSEFGGQGSVAGEDANSILSSLRGLIRSKYGDIILLCTVTVAFCMLLALSASS